MNVLEELRRDVSSPVTTPGSVVDEEKFLVPYSTVKIFVDRKWYAGGHLPIAIITASVLEIVVHVFSTDHLHKVLRFEPYNMLEVWRFLTYMLLHEDWLHLILNVIMQLIFAYFLENRHGHLRVLALYLIGGITGVLGASCIHPDLVIGASAGVYALLISHLADVFLNFDTMKYYISRCFCIAVIVIFDVAFNLVHVYSRDEPLISWGAHFIGGISGLLVGLALFKCDETRAKLMKRLLFWSGLIFYIVLMISLVILTVQIKKCTPFNVVRTRYVYFC